MAAGATEDLMEDEVMANSQTKKVEIGIEEALVTFQQVAFAQLIGKKEEMFFKVSINYWKTHSLTSAQLEDFPKIIQLIINGQEDSHRFLGCLALRKLLSRVDDPPYLQTVESGVVPTLISYTYRMDFEDLQLEAVWCLTNIASDTEVPELVQTLVNYQILPALKRLLF